MVGPSVRHGLHHGAQKSTTTGSRFEASRTSCSNVAVVTSIGAPSRRFGNPGGHAPPLCGPPVFASESIARHDERPSAPDRKSTRLNSSHVKISYAVFCLKKKNNIV